MGTRPSKVGGVTTCKQKYGEEIMEGLWLARRCVSSLSRSYSTTPSTIYPKDVTWLKKMARLDYKRRLMVREHAAVRLRLKSMKMTEFLPGIVKDTAKRELHVMPKDSSYVRVRNRCIMTDRPRSVYLLLRMSRHKFKQLADTAQLPGIKRATW